MRVGPHLLDRHGYLAGQDTDRAADINAFFADTSIRAVLPIRGGWGSSRVLPYLDFDAIRRNPKVLVGYSDITALLLGDPREDRSRHVPRSERDGPMGHVLARLLQAGDHATGNGSPSRTRVTVGSERADPDREPNADDHARQSARPAAWRQPHRTHNNHRLAVPAGLGRRDSLLRRVGENYYRIDRMLTQLKLAGILARLAGFVFGTCSGVRPRGAGTSERSPSKRSSRTTSSRSASPPGRGR